VISPYRKQVTFLREQIEDLSITVQTIDSFQGQERDIILISLVRSNDNQQIGFLSDYRRMNVAMTRAKLKLVIIGDSATLGSDSFYQDLLTWVEEKGTYRSAYEFLD
jgi:ATP-dependent RNA/DNA helicase IGHMBP2